MNYLLIDNKKKIVIFSIIFIFLISLLIITYNFSKKEDPRYTSYSCNQSGSLFDQSLLSDKKIKVLSATSWEESISPFSLILGQITSMNKIASLVDESNKLVSLAKQKKSDFETTLLTIPKNSCYISVNIGQLYQIDRSVTQSQSSKVEVYKWIKNYRDYLSRDFHTANTVVILDNFAIHTQINSSTRNSISDFSNLISGIKIKITVYDLDNTLPEVI